MALAWYRIAAQHITRARLLLRWPRNAAQFEFSLLKAGILLFNIGYSFWVISENIMVSHVLPRSKLFELRSCCRQFGDNFSLCDIIGRQSCRIRWNNEIDGHYAVQGHSRSLISHFGTSWKPVSNFLSVSDSNLRPILHCFPDMADFCWSNFRCQQGVPVFNAVVAGEPQNSVLWNLASRN